MVAITVILAAVIGTFVLGLGSNVQQNAQAGVTFQQSGDTTAGDSGTVTITVNSIQRADSFKVTVTEGGSATTGSDAAEPNKATTFEELSVGETVTLSKADKGEVITVVAEYDGNENVIGEYTVK